jgi:hypothetical protein
MRAVSARKKLPSAEAGAPNKKYGSEFHIFKRIESDFLTTARGMKIKPLPAGFVVLSAAGMQGCAGATCQLFRVEMLADLVAQWLAHRASRYHMKVDKRRITIVRISDAGARRSGAQGASW